MQESLAPSLARSIERYCAEGGGPRIVVQPIAHIDAGDVAGFEALARFDGPPRVGPDRWFSQAHAMGLGVELEHRAFEGALRLRSGLPPNTFLSINVSPALLDATHLDAVDDWARIVLEITEHEAVADYDRLTSRVEALRDRGALFAVDDAGAGYASLRHVLALRPDFVKLDRLMVDGIATDVAKRAVVETLGELASRIDAWIIAEGVETLNDLEELHRLGVPLVQGYLLARPAPPWPTLAPEAIDVVQRRNLRTMRGVEHLVERRATIPLDACADASAIPWDHHDEVLVRDATGRVSFLLRRGDATPVRALLLEAITSVDEAARRAMTRPRDTRFDPIAVHDATGAVLGLVPIDRLVAELAKPHAE